MPRYKLIWWERTWWEVEIEARDRLQAEQKFNDWDDAVADGCHESDDSYIDKSDVIIEVVRRTRNNANINSIN